MARVVGAMVGLEEIMGAGVRKVGWSTWARVRIGVTLILPSLQVDPFGRVKGPCVVLVIEWQPRWTNCVYMRYTGD